MKPRILSPADAAAFQALRLQGLREVPTAFASSLEEEADAPLDAVAGRLQPTEDAVVYGAFDADGLCGLLGLRRESMRKLRHKAIVWGMYVRPQARRAGHAQRLLQQALAHARHTWGVRQVNLGVHADNPAAIALYRRHGFEVFGTERGALCVDGQDQDELHMACRWPAGPA